MEYEIDHRQDFEKLGYLQNSRWFHSFVSLLRECGEQQRYETWQSCTCSEWQKPKRNKSCSLLSSEIHWRVRTLHTCFDYIHTTVTLSRSWQIQWIWFTMASKLVLNGHKSSDSINNDMNSSYVDERWKASWACSGSKLCKGNKRNWKMALNLVYSEKNCKNCWNLNVLPHWSLEW